MVVEKDESGWWWVEKNYAQSLSNNGEGAVLFHAKLSGLQHLVHELLVSLPLLALPLAARQLALQGVDLLVLGGHLLKLSRLLGVELLHLGPGAAPLAANLAEHGGRALGGRDGRRVLDDFEDLRVDGDIEVLALGQLRVPLIHALAHEAGDGGPDDGVAHVQDPLHMKLKILDNYDRQILESLAYLARQHRHVLLLGQVPPDHRIPEGEAEDLRDAERLVLGRVHVPDLARLYRLLLLAHDRLHEVDVDALELGQVEAAVHGEQADEHK